MASLAVTSPTRPPIAHAIHAMTRGCFAAGYAATLLAMAALAAALLATNFRADGSLLPALLQGLLIVAVVAWMRRLGWLRLALGIEVMLLATACSICLGLLSLILAASAHPFVDAALDRWDRLLFGDAVWPATLAIVRGWPRTMRLLSVVYDMLNLQPLLLIPALLLCRQGARLRVFALAWMASLAASVLVSALTPAVGTYLYFGVSPASVPDVHLPVAWEHIRVLGAVRAGGMRVLGMDTLYGIVTFPSFHAAGALLLGWAGWGSRALRGPFVALNVALGASAVFIGGHFLVDILAGVAIALLALWAASAIERRRVH